MMDIVIRPAAPDDLEILWEFQVMAAYETDVASAKAVPMVASYLAGWPRPGDFGFVAERDGAVIGAAWARQFTADGRPTVFAEDRTPELSIGVRQHARGQGVGQILLRALMTEAADRGLRLCLNVRQTNPAWRLYARLGFQAVPGMTVKNRVGGLSSWMVWDACEAPGSRSDGDR